ncbi:MAG: hypothetical protein ACPGQL_08320 [Thermoplasmatota archaeon]
MVIEFLAGVTNGFDAFGRLAGVFHSIAVDLAGARRASRERAATLYDQIGACVMQVAQDLENDIQPHGPCQELEQYALDLPKVIKKRALKERVVALSEDLRRIHAIETLYPELERVPDRAAAIGQLHGVAGSLRASANLLRAA